MCRCAFRFVSTAQLLCWFLFLAAVVYHSRTSAAVIVVAVLGCILCGSMSVSLRRTFTDATFLYNVIPLLLALGGHYLRLDALSVLWSLMLVVLLALCWEVITRPFTVLGLPLLCLPLNVLLAASILVFERLQRFSGRLYVIPPALAVGSPEQVRLWVWKAECVQACWKKLSKTPRRQIPK